MKEFKHKNKSSFWHSPIFLLVLFCFLILFIYNTIGLIKKDMETAKKKNIAISKTEELKIKKEFYEEEINKLNTEKGIEELARSKYQIAKPGEKVVSIVIEEENKESSDKEKDDNNLWSFFKNMFK